MAARAAIKARRPDLPVGLVLAIVDDVVVGDDPSVRDRKRAEVYERWLELARDDDFIGVQNYERVRYDGDGPVPTAEGTPRNQMGTAIEPLSLAGAVATRYEVAGVPVLVTEHGMATPRRQLRAAFIEPSLRGLLDAMDDGVPVLGYLHWTLMDNFEWIFGYGTSSACTRSTARRSPARRSRARRSTPRSYGPTPCPPETQAARVARRLGDQPAQRSLDATRPGDRQQVGLALALGDQPDRLVVVGLGQLLGPHHVVLLARRR